MLFKCRVGLFGLANVPASEIPDHDYNSPLDEGGQRYDLYIRGGEFPTRQLAFEGAEFRMQRTLPLQYFMTICNTGQHDGPYGNGGVRYDDIYMAPGRDLSSPFQ